MKSVLKFLYIEDEVVFMKMVIKDIDHFFKTKGYNIEWTTYEYISEHISFREYDACFLDIEVNGKNVLDYIDDSATNTPLICISQFEEHVFEAFHLQAYDFLRKTHLQDELNASLERLMKRIQLIEIETIYYDGRPFQIKINDINFIEVSSHRCVIHTVHGEEYEFFKDYSSIFSKKYDSLIRVHKKYVINVDNCVQATSSGAYVLGYKYKLPLGREQSKTFPEQFLQNLRRRNPLG